VTYRKIMMLMDSRCRRRLKLNLMTRLPRSASTTVVAAFRMPKQFPGNIKQDQKGGEYLLKRVYLEPRVNCNS
jgi:hypothetical protein